MSAKQTFEQATDRWKCEKTNQLGAHFHKLNINNDQYERVKQFRMSANDRDAFIGKMTNPGIKHIEMHLALMDQSNNTFNGYFIMKVTDTADHHIYLDLLPDAQAPPPDPDDPISDLVPKIFKEMIAKNWDEADVHELDSLFSAIDSSMLKRVQFFDIDDCMISFINQELITNGNELNKIRIYPGIDFNKMNDKACISFTPVLGFEMKNPIQKTGSGYLLPNCTRKEIFIEYSLPCPPTCPDRSVNKKENTSPE